MTKTLLAFFLLSFMAFTAGAQSRTITGIISADSIPLGGVSIAVKGTSIGTSSAIDGGYSLKVPAAAKSCSSVLSVTKRRKSALAKATVWT